MTRAARRFKDTGLERQGFRLAATMRWLAMVYAAVLLVVDRRQIQVVPYLTCGLIFVTYKLISQVRARRHPEGHGAKLVGVFADSLTVGSLAAFSGGFESRAWLLLYPHVVGVAVRGSMLFGAVACVQDAAIVLALGVQSSALPRAALNALILIWCGLMAGFSGAYLQAVRRRLADAHEQLLAKNQEQEKTLADLQRSEERGRLLLERIQDGVLILQDGKVAYANEVFARMVGATRESLMGMAVDEFAPPEEREAIRRTYRQFEEGQLQRGALEARLLTATRGTLLVSLRAGLVEFHGRRSVIATIRDITRKRQMEREVKAQAEHLAVLNQVADAVNASLQIEDILAVAASQAQRIVPFDQLRVALLEEHDPTVELMTVGHQGPRRRAEFGSPEIAWALDHPTTWRQGEPAPPHLFELLGADDALAAAILPLTSKDRAIGAILLSRNQAEPFDPSQIDLMAPVTRHIAIALDNARLLEAVRRRSREFELLFDIGRGIAARRDLDDLLPRITRGVNTIMATKVCLLLLRDGDTLHLASQEGLEPEARQVFERMRVGESLSGWVAEHGEPLMVPQMDQDPRFRFPDVALRFGYRSLLCVPLMRGDEVMGTLEVATREQRQFLPEERDLMAAFADSAAVAIENARLFDETRAHLANMAEANRRLQELDRERQDYLRNVSHEFRSPLTIIKGYAEYLSEPGAHDERVLREVMRITIESCDRLIDLVDTLLEVSRLEQGLGRQVLQIQKLDLRDVVETSLDWVRHVAKKRAISLEADLAAEALSLQGDRGLLSQVVKKLVDNAVKYSANGSRVLIRARAEGGRLALEVEDFGIGIPPEHIPRIFDKFYMVDGGLARRVGGTGVGLYLVREIVRLHDGQIDVKSLPGKGSLFVVHLPRAASPATQQVAAAS